MNSTKFVPATGTIDFGIENSNFIHDCTIFSENYNCDCDSMTLEIPGKCPVEQKMTNIDNSALGPKVVIPTETETNHRKKSETDSTSNNGDSIITGITNTDSSTNGEILIFPASSGNTVTRRRWSWRCSNKINFQRWKRLLKFGRQYFCVWPLLMFATWATLYSMWGEPLNFPGGSLFAFFILEISAIVLGEVMEWCHLPPLIGMLAAGLLCRNIPGSSLGRDLTIDLSAPLRAVSVVILLIRGAFSVSPRTIRHFSQIIPQLSLMTCIIEALVGGVAVYFLTNFPVSWAAFIGCMMSGMSQVVLLPFLDTLDGGTGEFGGPNPDPNINKVMTIVRGGCGLDAILSISLAECCLGFIFADGDLGQGLAKGVGEVFMGAAFGLLWGFLAGHLLNEEHCIEIRTFAVLSGGVMSLVGLNKIGYPRAGPSGIWVGSLVCSVIWRGKQIDGKNNDQVNESFTKLWFLFQPVLFGVIGIRTDLGMVDWGLMGKGMLCLVLALAARLVTAVLMSTRVSLTVRQMLFVACCWIPKGTVQADLGPMALDMVVAAHSGGQAEDLAHQAMNMAVLTILFGSILGSISMLVIGPKLLSRDENENESQLKAIS